jgi:hypothetical protein
MDSVGVLVIIRFTGCLILPFFIADHHLFNVTDFGVKIKQILTIGHLHRILF